MVSLQILVVWEFTVFCTVPVFAGLSAKHSDLCMEEEKRENLEAFAPWFLFSFSPWGPYSTGCLLENGILQIPSPPLPFPVLFLHLEGPKGFVSVCVCQMPILCSSLCVHGRKTERGRGFRELLSPFYPDSGGRLLLVLCCQSLCNWLVHGGVGATAFVSSNCWNVVEWWWCLPCLYLLYSQKRFLSLCLCIPPL